MRVSWRRNQRGTAARRDGVTIMHPPVTFAPGYGELSRHPYGILQDVVDGSAFVKGQHPVKELAEDQVEQA
jgi:hypothetical protein